MSFNSHRRAVLDEHKPLHIRASHTRSCALLVAQKYRINREAVIERVHQLSGISLHEPQSAEELIQALGILEALKKNGWESAPQQ